MPIVWKRHVTFKNGRNFSDIPVIRRTVQIRAKTLLSSREARGNATKRSKIPFDKKESEVVH